MAPSMSTDAFDQPITTKDETRADVAKHAPPSRSPGSFWSRHSTIINFWLDVALLFLFLVQAWIFGVLHVVFPRGAGPDWKLWGATALDWSESLFSWFCVFAVGIVLHLMFHWEWICGVVATRFLGRKPGKDDGSHTLLGVGIVVLLMNLLVCGIVMAKFALVGPS